MKMTENLTRDKKEKNNKFEQFYHSQLWGAIDKIAELKGISVSKLAQNANLDPTAFNKSKRVMKDGKLRWPSTESILRVLTASELPLEKFVSLIDSRHFKYFVEKKLKENLFDNEDLKENEKL